MCLVLIQGCFGVTIRAGSVGWKLLRFRREGAICVSAPKCNSAFEFFWCARGGICAEYIPQNKNSALKVF